MSFFIEDVFLYCCNDSVSKSPDRSCISPPSIRYVDSLNELSKDLQVTITHPVPNAQIHYIKEVVVTINGKVVNDSRYTSQPGRDTFTYLYPIVTVTGDEIGVTASCILTGSLSRAMDNTGPLATMPSAEPLVPPTQKAAVGCVPLFGAAGVLLIRRK